MARLFAKANHDRIDLTLPALSSAVTISHWFNLTSTPGTFPNGYVFLENGNTTGPQNYQIGIDSANANVIDFNYTTGGGGATVTLRGATYTFDAGVWHNLVISSDFTLAGTHMYLDGVALTVTNPTGTPGTPDHTNNYSTLGVHIPGGATDYYNGNLADVAIWNTTLSSTAAAQLAAGYRPVDVNSANLQFWMPLSGYSSPEPDISGNANNGTVTGTSQAAMPPSLGRGGRSFNGSSDGISASLPIAVTNNFSMSFWLYQTSNSGTQVLFYNGNGGSNGYGIYFDGASGKLLRGLMGGVASCGSASISLSTWHFAAFTVDASDNWAFYVDSSTAVGTGTNTPVTPTGSLGIGFDASAVNNYFPGLIADAAIWNTQLSSGQIAQLLAGVRPINVNSANLKGWWPLDGFTNSTETDRSGNSNTGTLSPGSASGPFPILGPPQLWRLSA